MTLIITSEKIVNEIQEEFNALFPFLRMEFYTRTIHKSKETVKKIANHISIGKAHKLKELKKIEISPCMTVRDFKNDFENKFGISVQLYRKSGTLWQKITITDSWTMKQQDETGNEISSIINNTFNAEPKDRQVA